MNTTSQNPHIRTHQGNDRPRRRIAGAVVGLIATLASFAALPSPAGAAVSNGVGGYADTAMHCSTWSTALGFNKSIQLDVRDLRGFDYARVYRYGSNGGSGWVTGTSGGGFWVRAHEIDGLAINPTRFSTAIIVQYADYTSNGWVYSSEIAFRSDGLGAWC